MTIFAVDVEERRFLRIHVEADSEQEAESVAEDLWYEAGLRGDDSEFEAWAREVTTVPEKYWTGGDQGHWVMADGEAQ